MPFRFDGVIETQLKDNDLQSKDTESSTDSGTQFNDGDIVYLKAYDSEEEKGIGGCLNILSPHEKSREENSPFPVAIVIRSDFTTEPGKSFMLLSRKGQELGRITVININTSVAPKNGDKKRAEGVKAMFDALKNNRLVSEWLFWTRMAGSASTIAAKLRMPVSAVEEQLKSAVDAKGMTDSIPEETGISNSSSKEIIRLGDVYSSRDTVEFHLKKLLRLVEKYHEKHPNMPGMRKEELNRRSRLEEPFFLALVEVLSIRKQLVLIGEAVKKPDFSPVIDEKEAVLREQLLELLLQAELAVPPPGAIVAATGIGRKTVVGILEKLAIDKSVVRVSEYIYIHGEVFKSFLKGMDSSFKGKRFKISDFKSHTGLSRKYALPLLDYLGIQGYVDRKEDSHIWR